MYCRWSGVSRLTAHTRYTRCGSVGVESSGMCASAGVRLPLRVLQELHAVTQFSHVLAPPREMGLTWSRVRESLRLRSVWCLPQY